MITILIVEDDDAIRNNIVRLLKLEGFDTISAPDGNTGLDRALEFKPGLIISDVGMPGMNGFQATRTLSRDPATADVPVVMITTKSMETDRVWGLRQGAKAFITKPVNEKELLSTIASLLPNKH